MNRRNIVWGLSVTVVLVLTYFLINMYTNSQYVSRLPEMPNLNESSGSFQKYLNGIHSKTLDNPSADNMGELGMVYHANNYFKEAEVCYLLANDRDSEEWKWSYYLGCLKQRLGDSESAIKYFNDVLKIQPDQYMAKYYIAEAYSQLGQSAIFEEILLELSNMKKELFVLKETKRTSYFFIPVYARFELAKMYANTGKVDLAVSQLESLISSEISFGPAYKQLSIIYAEKGDEELRRYYSERSKDLVEYVPPADVLLDRLSYYSRSETYLLKRIEDAVRSNNINWAMELVNTSLKNVPDSKYIVSKAVRLFMVNNMAGRGIPYVDKHLVWFKDDYKELVDFGTGFSNIGMKNIAKRYFLLASKSEKEKPETKSRLAGMFYDRLGMKEKSLELMNELLEQYPNDPAAINGATMLYIQMGDLVNAKKYLSRFKKMDPKNPRINILSGILAKNSDDIKGSVKFYEKAFEEISDQGFIIIYLSEYYKKNKMWVELNSLYKKAVKSSPNNPNIQAAYASFLINCPDENMRDATKARELSERAWINFRSDVGTQVSAGHSLALSYAQLKNMERADYYLRKTINKAKKGYFPREYIAILSEMSKDFQKNMNSN